MVAYLNRSIGIATDNRNSSPGERDAATAPGAPAAPRPSRLHAIAKRIWSMLVTLISGPGLGASGGIDDSAMPSGFIAPYGRGSRQVRNLWHMPF